MERMFSSQTKTNRPSIDLRSDAALLFSPLSITEPHRQMLWTGLSSFFNTQVVGLLQPCSPSGPAAHVTAHSTAGTSRIQRVRVRAAASAKTLHSNQSWMNRLQPLSPVASALSWGVFLRVTAVLHTHVRMGQRYVVLLGNVYFYGSFSFRFAQPDALK